VENGLEINQQAAEIKQAAVWFQVHEEINVATGITLASRNRAKNADVSRPTLGRNPKNLVALCRSKVLQCHRNLSLPPLIRAHLLPILCLNLSDEILTNGGQLRPILCGLQRKSRAPARRSPRY
jgi:hypothetical protein